MVYPDIVYYTIIQAIRKKNLFEQIIKKISEIKYTYLLFCLNFRRENVMFYIQKYLVLNNIGIHYRFSTRKKPIL